jgi:PBSX family phage terminase large subunit
MPTVALTRPQTEFFQSDARFTAFCGGFGSGKTTALVAKMLADKFQYPDVSLLYCAPTYTLIKDIAWPAIAEMMDGSPLRWKINKASNDMHIEGYGKILFRTMDAPERIVGFNVGRAYLDELDTLNETHAFAFWRKVIARMRQTSRDPSFTNQISIATTPEGYRFCYKVFARKHADDPDYRLIKAPTHSNPHLPEGYISSLKNAYPEHLVDAYLNGEFVNLTSGAVYYNYDRILNDTTEYFPHGTPSIHVGMDFNVHNMSAVCALYDGHTLHVCQEYHGVKDTPTLLRYLSDDLLTRYTHRMIVYPDASGKHTSSTNASESDLRMIRSTPGFSVDAPTKNPLIQDRVNSVNAALCNSLGERRLYVHRQFCPRLAECLEQQVYDERTGKPDKTSDLDHLPDALGYLVHRLMPVAMPKGLSTIDIVGI